MRRSSPFWPLALLVAVLPTTGCLFRTRPVEETYSKTSLREATQSRLIDGINQQAERTQSLQATVDIDTSAGGVKKGHVTDYKEIRSNGQEFKLWIPPKNRFVVGRNEVETHNINEPMENIRPQDIYEALLIRRIDPEQEIAVLENGFEILHDAKGLRVLQADYELVVIRKGEQGWRLSRKIVFSRADLQPHRQYIYDEQEEYDIKLNMLKLEINKPLRDDQFALEQPPGAEVVHLDKPQSSAAAPPVDTRQ